MADQPRYEPLEPSAFCNDGISSRQIPDGTVARGHLRSDTHLFQGPVNSQPATEFPFPDTKVWLARGHPQYAIFCFNPNTKGGHVDVDWFHFSDQREDPPAATEPSQP